MTKLLIINAIANHIFIGECKLKPWHKVSKAETTRHGAEQQAPLKKNMKPSKKPHKGAQNIPVGTSYGDYLGLLCPGQSCCMRGEFSVLSVQG